MKDELKEIIAVIRPDKWRVTQQALFSSGVTGVSQQRVLGRGRQSGLKYVDSNGAKTPGMDYLPKRQLSCIVLAEQVEAVVKAIIDANRSGNPGDGKVFVCPADEAIRLRTGERGTTAISK